MLVTSGYNFEGYEILEYVGHESAQIVLGTGFISSLGSSFADILGTTSSTYQDKLSVAELACKQILITKAAAKGCNAIIGIDVDYTVFHNDIMGVVVGGTFVKVAKKVPEKSERSFTVGRYNLSHSLRCCNVILMNTIKDNSTYISISGKFFGNNKLDALKVSFEFKTLFNESIKINDVTFAEVESKDDSEFATEYVKIDIDTSVVKVIDSVDAIPTVFISNKQIVNIDCKQDVVSPVPSETLVGLRKKNGCDAVVVASKNYDEWTCFCGQHNSLTTDTCEYCKRTVKVELLRIVLPQDALNPTFDYAEHLAHIKECNNANEIYEYLVQFSYLDTTIENVILPKLSKLKYFEKLHGNSKKSAISFITGIWGIE